MKSLPLFVSDLLEVEKTDPLRPNSDCRECGMGGRGPVTCMGPSTDKKSAVLVVGGSLPWKYAKQGEPFAGGVDLRIKRRILSKVDSACFDYAVKCPGSPQKMSEARCRPYLYQTFLDADPERVILLGRLALQGFLGWSYNASHIRNGYVTTYDGVPVFLLPDPLDVANNSVLKKWFLDDLDWALEADPEETPYDASYHVIETVAEARRACEIVKEHGVTCTDLETYGQQYCADFKVVAQSISHPWTDESWVWNEDALAEGDPRREPLVVLLRSQPISAHSSDMEVRSIKQHFGVSCTVAEDTKVTTKLVNPDGPADLDWVGAHVGMGAHKTEAKADLEKRVKILNGLREARRKPVVVEYEKITKIDKRGRKYTRKVPTKTRPQSLQEQMDSIRDAWTKSRTINGRKGMTYQAVAGCSLTEDWINAALSDYNPKAYIYGLMDRDLCLRYNALDTVVHARKVRRDQELFRAPAMESRNRVYTEIMIPLMPAVSRMIDNGLLIDQAALGEFEAFLDGKIEEYRSIVEEYAPGMNPGSDEQKQKFLFGPKSEGGLGLPVLKETGTGAPSADASVLKRLRDEHPVIEALKGYAEVAKLQSNYARGLRPHIADDGRIHASLNPTGTGTGRWSCSKPNMQTLPSRGQYAKMAKMLYVAPPGYKLVALDFSTLEVRLAAYRSGDKRMIELLCTKDSKGKYLDFHMETAKMISKIVWGTDLKDCGLGYTFDDLIAEWGSEAKAEEDPRWGALSDVIAYRRKVAKQINFSLIYGQGTETLSERAGCTVEEAGNAKEAILGGFRGLRDWMDRQKKLAHREGGVWTRWQDGKFRFRHIVDIGYKDRGRVGHGERVAVNTPIQGEGSDFNADSIVKIDRWIEHTGVDAKLLMAVHDSNIAEVRDDLVMDYARQAHDVMVDHDCGPVPVLVDCEYGQAYGAMSALELSA